MMELMIYIAGTLIFLLGLIFIVIWATTYHPDKVQDEPVVCSEDAPLIRPGQKLKVLNWNVQYMAGKNYIFWYDLPKGSGPDTRPTPEDIAVTLKRVANVIIDEDPDIVLLQEIDDGAKRTDHEDQLEKLLALLPETYCCYTSTFYWKAAFVPHPKIMGSVGLKLSTISKYRVSKARRHQLPFLPNNPITRQFYLKRAILEARFPQTDGNQLVILNTHFESFGQGTNTMQRQVHQTVSLLTKLSTKGFSWMIGGDFNLLPSESAYNRLMESEKKSYLSKTEITAMYERYRGVPSIEDVDSSEYKRWFTHFSNEDSIKAPDRTIDYIFISNDIQLGAHYVRQEDTINISDHLPVVVEAEIP